MFYYLWVFVDQLLLSGEKSQQNYKLVQLRIECVLSCKSEKCLVELLINTAWFDVFCVHRVRGLMFKHVACVSAFINFLFFSENECIKIYMRFFCAHSFSWLILLKFVWYDFCENILFGFFLELRNDQLMLEIINIASNTF